MKDYDDCTSEHYRARALKECKCLPFSMATNEVFFLHINFFKSEEMFQEELCTAEMLKCVENMDKHISFDQCKPKCTGLVVIGYEKSSNFELDKFKSFKDQYAAFKGETLIPQFYESRDSF